VRTDWHDFQIVCSLCALDLKNAQKLLFKGMQTDGWKVVTSLKFRFSLDYTVLERLKQSEQSVPRSIQKGSIV
jgi:hypothetical protein